MSIVIKLTKKYGRLVMPGLTRHPASLNTVKQQNLEPLSTASEREAAKRGATKCAASRAKLNLDNTRRRVQTRRAVVSRISYHVPKCIFCFAVYSICSISGAPSAGTPRPM